jgi:hypothetical protein
MIRRTLTLAAGFRQRYLGRGDRAPSRREDQGWLPADPSDVTQYEIDDDVCILAVGATRDR